MDLRWAPLRIPDAAAWAQLIVDAETVDHTGEYYGAEDLAEELADLTFVLYEAAGFTVHKRTSRYARSL